MFQRKIRGIKLRIRAALKRAAGGADTRRTRLQFENLEARTLLSVVPNGGEFQVNAYTTSDQRFPSVASDAAGDYVVAWQSYDQFSSGSSWDIYAQLYTAAGGVKRSEFLVNSYTTDSQQAPSVAMDSAGDFVVAWESSGQNYVTSVYAQRYNAAGAAQGGEFEVSSVHTSNGQRQNFMPSVAMDANGDFVVAWAGYHVNGSPYDLYDVYATRYNAAGELQSSGVVNQFTTDAFYHWQPKVAMDAAGDFVVSWTGGPSPPYDIYARRYNAAGMPIGDQFEPYSDRNLPEVTTSVAMDANGDFVVAWDSYNSLFVPQVYASLYDSQGNPVLTGITVSTDTTGHQTVPSVAMDHLGDFVVTWLVDGDIHAKVYNPDGTFKQDEFSVTSHTTDDQASPTVAMNGGGDPVIAWENLGQDGSGWGIFAQRYLNQSTVNERNLFYAGSARYDLPGGSNGRTPLSFSDDNAIAADKIAYLPDGSSATFANVSSYNLGINGIMVDLLGGGTHSLITTSDFVFKSGNTASVDGTWTTLSGANLPAVSVRLGMIGAANGTGTTSGSDRVELIWASGTAVTQNWLEVTVLANGNTGLAANDVFFFGSEIGDANQSNSSTVFKVGAADTTATQTHLANVASNQPITNLFDYNRDGSVGAVDVTTDQTHGTNNTTGLKVITIASSGPFGPPPAASPPVGEDFGVASAFAGNSSATLAVPAGSAWIAPRLEQIELNQGQVAKYIQQFTYENTASAGAILAKTRDLAGEVDGDDTLSNSQ